MTVMCSFVNATTKFRVQVFLASHLTTALRTYFSNKFSWNRFNVTDRQINRQKTERETEIESKTNRSSLRGQRHGKRKTELDAVKLSELAVSSC